MLMGPLFSIALLGILAAIATLIAFVIAKLLLPLKAAFISAILFVGFAGAGTLAALLVQSLWLPERLEGVAVLLYLGISAAVGLACGTIAVRLFLTRGRDIRISS